MAWASLLGMAVGGAGSYAGTEAAKGDAKRQQQLGNSYQDAYNQYANWQNQGQTGNYERQHQLAQLGFQNQQQLGQALGSSDRDLAGASGRAMTQQGQAQALGGVYRPTMRNPGGAAADAWGANAYQQRQVPTLAARAQMLQQMGAQRGMANYDRNALGASGDTAVDLGRQSQEATQKEAALGAYRQQLLEGAGVQYQYRGPGAGYYNAQLFGQGANLASQGLLSYGSSQQQPSYGGYGSGGGGSGGGQSYYV